MLVPIANRNNMLANILTNNVGSNVGQHVGTVWEGLKFMSKFKVNDRVRITGTIILLVKVTLKVVQDRYLLLILC